MQNGILTKLPGSGDTKYTTSQHYLARPEENLQTQEVLILILVLLLLNSRMQLRIHGWETEPSQGKPADTAHCCVGVDALHEVCCCSVWERGEKPNAHARSPVVIPTSCTQLPFNWLFPKKNLTTTLHISVPESGTQRF